MFRTIAVLLVSLCLFAAPLATSGQTPAKLELAQNWKLAAAKDVSADGVALSQPAYDDHKWFPIHRMPATVARNTSGGWRLFRTFMSERICSKGFRRIYTSRTGGIA